MDTAQALKPHALVGQGYVVLAVEGHDGLSWHYRGQDLGGRTNFDILEYFPDGLAVRTPDGSVAAESDGAAAAYQRGRKQFLARARTLAGSNMPGLASVRQPVEERNSVYSITEAVE